MELKLELELKKTEALHGESVGLLIRLTNEGGKPAEQIQTFEPRNESLRLLVGTRYEGDQLGKLRRERTGPRLLHWHKKRMTLQPGQAVLCTGDLVDWVGALGVGDHRLRAEYDPGDTAGTPAVGSNEVSLRIVADTPTFASRPRLGEVGEQSPFPVLWREKKDKEAAWLVAQHSRVLPPNPYSGPRVADLPPDVEPRVAGVLPPWPLWAHACWVKDNAIHVLPFSLYGQGKGKPVNVPADVAGAPLLLDSPCTILQNELALLYTDAGRNDLRLVQLGGKGAPATAELPLGDAKPIDQYCAYWLFDRRLAFAWTVSGSKRLYFALCPLGDPADAFAPAEVATLAATALRLDIGASHREAPGPEALATTPEPPPDENAEEDFAAEGVDDLETISTFTFYALLAERQPRRLSIAAISRRTGAERVLARIPVPDTVTGDLAAHDSVMRIRRHPAYIVRDAQNRLYYCSTQIRELRPLEAIAGEAVSPAEFPCLVAASGRSDTDWVYLRYFSRREGGFRYVKAEPTDRPDPYSLRRQQVAVLRWY